jgi:hypothetical protein
VGEGMIEKLREILSERTPGRWEKKAWAGIQAREYEDHFHHVADCFQGPDDARAIATLNNIADELLAVVEAARDSHGAPEYDSSCEICGALKALDDKIAKELP